MQGTTLTETGRKKRNLVQFYLDFCIFYAIIGVKLILRVHHAY